MPLVEHLELPTFARLREQGHEVLPLERAVHQDIRELHIGFLNMMPDTALVGVKTPRSMFSKSTPSVPR